MKNILLRLSFVFVISLSFYNVDKSNLAKDDDGKASDCVRMARTATLAMAENHGQDPNGIYFDWYINLYHNLYNACYNS